MSVHVTHHAIDRYIERVGAVDRAEAYAVIACADVAIEKARAFGARLVRLPNGAGLVLAGVEQIRVVTVLGRGQMAADSRHPRPAAIREPEGEGR